MLKVVGLTRWDRQATWLAAGIGVGLGLTAAILHRRQIAFYWQFWQAYRMGRRFYRNYPHLVRDIAYTGHPQPRLDVYATESGESHPVLIFVHGGTWKDYRKELFSPVALKLLPDNIVVVIPDYTLYPHAGYRQMADEVAAAASWTLENIQHYGGDPGQVILGGHSAGAHLMGLVGLDPRYLAAYGHSPAELAGLMGLSGVYDIEAQYRFEQSHGRKAEIMTAVMDGPANFAAASPIRYVRSDAPPFFLIHGAADQVVPAGIAVDFQAALERAGARSRLKLYPTAGHSDFLFQGLAQARAPIVDDLADFVRDCKVGG